MLRLDRTKKYLSVEARWPPKLCTHPLADVETPPVVEHLARAAASGSSDENAPSSSLAGWAAPPVEEAAAGEAAA